MERHFHEQLDQLRQRLIDMAETVESAIDKAVTSLVKRDSILADEVIQSDDAINRMEMEIDEACLTLLALHQPVASDLRFVTAAMKINNDLERMGDHAVNIAERAKMLNDQPPLKPLIHIPRMAQITQMMLNNSLNSFVAGNVKMARAVCIQDSEVDQLDDELFRELLTYMMDDTKTITRALNLLLISKNLERIADLSTNIAEEVIFIYDARTIKHHADNGRVEDIHTRS